MSKGLLAGDARASCLGHGAQRRLGAGTYIRGDMRGLGRFLPKNGF